MNNGYNPEVNLYHLLCGYIFDGKVFDYLVIIYEDVNSLNEYSDQLLCSYNRLIREGKGFVSFGDSNGKRKDCYRYLRMKELDQLPDEESRYVEYSVKELIDKIAFSFSFFATSLLCSCSWSYVKKKSFLTCTFS